MKKHYREEDNCLNCGTTLQGKFCHVCGQENLQIKESFGHMMNHAISDYFHFDHQFFHTLKPLLFKPGFLTNEYMAGKRVQYLHPVKMYIFISVVYFLVLFQTGREAAKSGDDGPKKAQTQKTIDSLKKEITNDSTLSPYKKQLALKLLTNYNPAKVTISKKQENVTFNLNGDTSITQYEANQQNLSPGKRDGFFKHTINQKLLTYKEKYGARWKDVFFEEFKHNVPKMMFVLLPIFALILRIVFWKSKKFYVEHLIYTFHLHCFAFLFMAILILVELVIPASWGITDWITFAAFVYCVWYMYRSLRVVYHRSKWRTVSKLIGISLTYSATAMVCLLLLLFITALTVA